MMLGDAVSTVLDPYSEDSGACTGRGTNNATQPDSDGFKIGSDVSDERTKITKTQRDPAAATLAEQKP